MTIRRAFSLIEVLIAVTVLALGLLGLAAVFPVVVGQQRDASNASAGEAVVSSVRAYLNGHEVLNTNNRGWGAVNQSIGTTGRMWVPLTDASDPALPTTWTAASGTDIIIPLSERLWPASSAVRQSGPRFVWDMAALAPNENSPFFDDVGLVRAAVFIRPVDANIRDRANPDDTPWNLLTGSMPPRVPIAEDMDGVPTRNGDPGTSGAYAELFSFDAEVYDYNTEGVWSSGDRADAILITGITDNVGRSTRQAEALLSMPGQRFIDRHGNVYRVTASKPIAGGVLIRIDPPVPHTVARSDDNENDISTDDINPFLASSVAPVADPIVLEIRP